MTEPVRMVAKISADDILDALIARSDDLIWASELAVFEHATSRIDFWTLEPVGGQIGYRTSAYEIKVSHADYRRDSAEKQAEALRWSDRFWYVTPAGLIGKDDVPEWAGLQAWDGEKFTVIKRAPRRCKAAPTWPLVISIIRNSGACRRDVSVMKTELMALKRMVERSAKQEKLRSKMEFDRWIAKSQSRARAEVEDAGR